MLKIASDLDLQDRFINTKYTKYLLLNKDFKLAEESASYFIKVK